MSKCVRGSCHREIWLWFCMRSRNASHQFKRFSLSQRVAKWSSNIMFALTIYLYNWFEFRYLTWSFSFFICFLFEHVIQQVRFETFFCNSQLRRQSSRVHLIFRVVQNFNDNSWWERFLFVLLNVLSKIFYNVDLRIILLEFETILCNVFFLFIIVIIFVVFRIIARFIRDSQKQTNDFIATIFIIKSISLFRAFFRIFNAIVVLSARVETALILKISIVVNLVFLIIFKELRTFNALRQRNQCFARLKHICHRVELFFYFFSQSIEKMIFLLNRDEFVEISLENFNINNEIVHALWLILFCRIMLLYDDETTILRILHQIDQKIREILSLSRLLNNFQILFFFIISALRRRVANELLCSTDLDSFRKKVEKIGFESVKGITCSVLKFLKAFIIVNIKIRRL